MEKFSKQFLIGASSAGYQVEGGNKFCNWHYEAKQGKVEACGQAVNHYHRFDEDFALAKNLGLNAMRMSIEWARLEPEQGKFDAKEVEHYHKVFRSLKARGLMPMVTLFHWTMPNWLYQQGGFASKNCVPAFNRFVRFVVHEYGREANLWCVINEPEVFVFESYLFGTHPPFKKNIFLALKVYRNLILAHKAGYKILKKYISHAQVGIAKNVSHHEAWRKKHLLDKVVVWVANTFGNQFFINRIKQETDFIGLNYYFSHLLKFDWLTWFKQMNDIAPRSDMGNRSYPHGVYELLTTFWRKFNKPLYVTENGIANANNVMRERFITEHLAEVARAKHEGVNVKGYFNWSLTDTYEWQSGYSLKFGLYEVNMETFERRLRITPKFFEKFRQVK